MKNKVVIKVIVPSLTESYEVYVPVNERVSKVKELLINIIYELSDNTLDKNVPYSILDPDSGTPYLGSSILRDTNIRNNKSVILIKKI